MAFPSDLVRTKNWGSEILTDADLEGQFDLIINWVMAALNSSSGHTHAGTSNQGPLLTSSSVSTTFGNGFTTVTAASGDYVLVATDVSDSNKTKKALVSDIVTLSSPTAASQAEMETASATNVPVTPGRAHFHPGAAKAWIKFNGTGTIAVDASYKVTSIADNGAGDYTITWATAFSSENYCVVATASSGTSFGYAHIKDQTTTTVRIGTTDNNGAGLIDHSIICVVAFGDV